MNTLKKIKKMVNSNHFGKGVELNNLPVNCSVYRFTQDKHPN